MKTAGIVAEYDPMHNGHLYQLQTAAEQSGADCSIIVLGSDFLQRGRPGFFNKRLRAEAAIESGADLVIQLPYIYSCSSGSEYASGAVSILNGTGCADFLSFGCEDGSTELLEKAADVVPEREPYRSLIKEKMSRGISYPEALTSVVSEYAGEQAAEAIRRRNNLLAAEYLRSLKRTGSGMTVIPVKRTETLPLSDAGPDSYAGKAGDLTVPASAGDIRKLIRAGKTGFAKGFVPEPSGKMIDNSEGGFITAEDEARMFRLLVYRILTMDRKALSEIHTVSEGIEARVIEAAHSCRSMDEMVSFIATRRYTRARVQRMLTHILMGMSDAEHDYLSGAAYVRVLGFSGKGRRLLRKMEKNSDIPILSNLYRMEKYDSRVRRSVELDSRASDLYHMISGRYDLIGSEKKFIPYMGRQTV